MHPQLERLRALLMSKPLMRQANWLDKEFTFNLMDGNLDFVAKFESAEVAEVLLRARLTTLERLAAEAKTARVNEMLTKNWKTEADGWRWVYVRADDAWTDETLESLLQESYEITIESLSEQSRKQYVRLLKNVGTVAKSPLDLTPDVEQVTALLNEAVAKYAALHANPRRALQHPEVTRVDLVFSLGDTTSTPWVHVHFDTKPGSHPDGAPTHPDFAKLKCKHWLPAVKAVSNGQIVLVTYNGLQQRREDLTEVIGNLLVDVLLAARTAGLFQTLPIAKGCELGVEDPTTGAFGWPSYQERGENNLA